VPVSVLYTPRIGPHTSLSQTDPGNTYSYINLSQIYESGNWETEHYNSVLEITVSFLGIHKWEPDIYIGFSPALHLQCVRVYMQFLHISRKTFLKKIRKKGRMQLVRKSAPDFWRKDPIYVCVRR
jgi:hypothetical protein